MISARAGPEGKLFGSVTRGRDRRRPSPRRPASTIDRRQLHLDEPIKTVGTHTRAGQAPRRRASSRSRSRSSPADRRPVASRGRSPRLHVVGAVMLVVPRVAPQDTHASPQVTHRMLALVSHNHSRPRCRRWPTQRTSMTKSLGERRARRRAESPGGGPRSRRTTSRRRSRCSGRCCCRGRRSLASELVTADDFYKPAHGHVYEAVTSLYGAGEPVDPVTVAEELRRHDLLEAIGGPATLISLQAARRPRPTPGATPRSSRSTRCCGA